MGETSVPLGALRVGAERIDRTAQLIDELDWPAIEPTALAGAALTAAVSSARLTAFVDDVVDDMRAWAVAARTAASELERADLRSAHRLP